MMCPPRTAAVQPRVATPASSNACTFGRSTGSHETSGRRLAEGMFGSVPTALPARNRSGAFPGEGADSLPGARAGRVAWAKEPEGRNVPVPGRTPRIDLTPEEERQ